MNRFSLPVADDAVTRSLLLVYTQLLSSFNLQMRDPSFFVGTRVSNLNKTAPVAFD